MPVRKRFFVRPRHGAHYRASRIQRAWRRRRNKTTIQKLNRKVNTLMKGVNHKVMTSYENNVITSAITTGVQHDFTAIYHEDFTPMPAGLELGSQRTNNKILLKSVKARLQFYPDATASADYYQFRILLVQFPVIRVQNVASNFYIDNVLSVLDQNVAFCYTHANYKSNLINSSTTGELPYKILQDRLITMRTSPAGGFTSEANNSSPAQFNLKHVWSKGLAVQFEDDSPGSQFKNIVGLYVLSSSLTGGSTRPTMDALYTSRWTET